MCAEAANPGGLEHRKSIGAAIAQPPQWRKRQDRGRQFHADRLGGLQIYHHLKLRRLLDWQIGGFRKGKVLPSLGEMCPGRHNDIDLQPDELCGDFIETLTASLSPAKLDRDIATLDPA